MEESVLGELFGNTPRVQIIDAFSDGIGDAWSKKEIQEITGLSKATILNNWAPLEEYGIIKVKKQIGNTKLYTLNIENKTTKILLKLEMELADHVAPKNEEIIKTKKSIPA
ncbi:MAG: winged helix-turn-helix domain-containing protein [Candidatus ainarchaeum sp.]|nr:winged helix-turn-helix domain-containing protein [Candidatus ainarchaeum sp.]